MFPCPHCPAMMGGLAEYRAHFRDEHFKKG